MSGSADTTKFDFRLALEERKRAMRELASLARISAASGVAPDSDVIVELSDFISGRRDRRHAPGSALDF